MGRGEGADRRGGRESGGGGQGQTRRAVEGGREEEDVRIGEADRSRLQGGPRQRLYQ